MPLFSCNYEWKLLIFQYVWLLYNFIIISETVDSLFASKTLLSVFFQCLYTVSWNFNSNRKYCCIVHLTESFQKQFIYKKKSNLLPTIFIKPFCLYTDFSLKQIFCHFKLQSYRHPQPVPQQHRIHLCALVSFF